MGSGRAEWVRHEAPHVEVLVFLAVACRHLRHAPEREGHASAPRAVSLVDDDEAGCLLMGRPVLDLRSL